MALITGRDALARLVEAVGLQQRRVRALTISVRVDEAVVIVAEMYADEEQMDTLADLLTEQPPVVVEVPGFLPVREEDFVLHIHPSTGQQSQRIPFRSTLAAALARGRAAAASDRSVVLWFIGAPVATWYPHGDMLYNGLTGEVNQMSRWKD